MRDDEDKRRELDGRTRVKLEEEKIVKRTNEGRKKMCVNETSAHVLARHALFRYRTKRKKEREGGRKESIVKEATNCESKKVKVKKQKQRRRRKKWLVTDLIEFK